MNMGIRNSLLFVIMSVGHPSFGHAHSADLFGNYDALTTDDPTSFYLPHQRQSADLLDNYDALTTDNPASFYLPHQGQTDLFENRSEAYAVHQDLFDHQKTPNDYLSDDMFSHRRHYVPDDPLYTYPKGQPQ